MPTRVVAGARFIRKVGTGPYRRCVSVSKRTGTPVPEAERRGLLPVQRRL